LAIPLLALLFAAGCGDEESTDDDVSSESQVQSLVDQFQDAAGAGDDEAACALMSEEMHQEVERPRVSVDGETQEVSCGVVAALRNPEAEESSLPEASAVYVAIDRHDESADVQLDNGTRLRLKRGGENADGEWRIIRTEYRPSPVDWEGDANPLAPSDPLAAARQVSECLEKAGFDTKVLPTDPADTDAPGAAVAFQGGSSKAEGGEVAIYESGVEAVDRLEALEETIKGFDGVSEPQGRAGVIFFGEPVTETRAAVLACVR
jgi:hypothetical protein